MILRIARWERALRYYELYEGEDLFGQAVLVQVWGGKATRRGGSRTLTGAPAALDAIKRRIGLRRQQRGYRLSTEEAH